MSLIPEEIEAYYLQTRESERLTNEWGEIRDCGCLRSWHHEPTRRRLTNTRSGASQITTIFDNHDAARGIAQSNGQPAGFIGIQSYPSSPFAFRDICIK